MADETTDTGAKPDFQRLIEQAKFRYDQASKNGDANAQREATFDLLRIYIESGTLENNVEFARRMQKVAPGLMENLAKIRQTLADNGAQKALELMKSIKDSQRQLLEKESKDIFDMVKPGYSQSVNMLGMLKSFAVVLQAFGIDTTEFVKRCDEGISSEMAKMPKINSGRLNDAGTQISTIGAELGVSRSTAGAIRELAEKAPEIAQIIVDIGQGSAPQTSAPASGDAKGKQGGTGTTADIETTRAITAIQDGLGIKTSLDLKKMVEQASGSQGDKDHLNAKEMEFLESKVAMGLATSGEKDAQAKAHEIIERIRAKASEPAPEPR